jgi:Zn-dependent metalloprotease/PKD repeat protein
MRKYLLVALASLISITAFSQPNVNLKKPNKKPAGTATPGFAYGTVSNMANRKSASVSPYKTFSAPTAVQNQVFSSGDTVKSLIMDDGAPIFFEIEKSTLKSADLKSDVEQFYSFFNSSKAVTGLSEPETELSITSSTIDNLGKTHVKGQQYFKGIKVDGADFYLHLGSQKDIFTGRLYKVNPQIDMTPEISKASALDIVNNDIKNKTVLRGLSTDEKNLLKYDSPAIELSIYKNKLAFAVEIRPNLVEVWRYFVDANTGQVLHSFNNTNSDGPTVSTGVDLGGVTRTLNTYLEAGKYKLYDVAESMYNATANEGMIITLNANNTSTVNLNYSEITSNSINSWNIPASVSAHYNAMTTFKYFKNTFGRNSINGTGGNIISLINVTNEDGSSMDNAFWNGKAAFFGNGQVAFKSLAGALDVTAHEMGHGIISNSANLEYQGQSGAINESFADVFGSMVDRDDWLIGEDITKTSFSPSGALRNMSSPHNLGNSNDNYWQPMHVSEMYSGDGDNGGVHINSGICNYAFYLFATAVTKAKAELIYYRALTTYLTSKSQFIDLRIAVVQSAKDLYGDSAPEVTQANAAFDAVGIQEEAKIDYSQDYPVNPGQEYFFLHNTDPADANSFYRASTAGTVFDPLTTTVSKGKASVTDDGTVATFVSVDNKIRSINTNPADPQEFILSEDTIWDNVCVSKDGTRIAAISTSVDTSIYIYDFGHAQWMKYRLYNPTTSSDGTNAGGVLYADEFEFDHTGEYLVYDAYNSLNSSTGADISYWDIGFMKVWDNATNNFGDGSISKLYGSLPENVSIGDPTFAKNSPYIMAFDYIDNNTNTYKIFGVNLLTGESDLIVTNNTIGYPSYSKNDDKIAYTTYAYDNSGNMDNFEDIAVVNVLPNKISGTGTAVVPIVGAKWPVYFATGSRSLGLAPVAYFTVDNKDGSTPLTVHYQDLSVNAPTSWSWSFPGGTPSNSNLQNPVVEYRTEGVYPVTLTCSNSIGNNSVTKDGYIVVSLGNDIRDFTNSSISYYPNPTKDKLFIKSESDYRLRIFSVTGKLLIDINNQDEVSLAGLQNGIYLLQIETEGKILSDKLIKQ